MMPGHPTLRVKDLFPGCIYRDALSGLPILVRDVHATSEPPCADCWWWNPVSGVHEPLTVFDYQLSKPPAERS
jgi:hypothetical protein